MVVGRDWGCLDQSFPGLTSQSLSSSVNSSPEAGPVSYTCRGSGAHSDLSCLMEGLRGQDWMGSKKDWGEVWGWPGLCGYPSLSAVSPSLSSSPATLCSPSLLDSPAPNVPRSPAPGEREKKLEPDHSCEPRAFRACPLLFGVRKF